MTKKIKDTILYVERGREPMGGGRGEREREMTA